MTAVVFANSYMITNRAYPTEQWAYYIYPTAPGTLFFFTARGSYNTDPQAYNQFNTTPARTMPVAYQTALATDLQRASLQGTPQITLYIHGLGNYFSDACQELGTYGTNLQAQGYNGLLIGFSWPSYGEVSSYEWYGSLPYRFPPAGTSGTIRDNIQGSVGSLTNLLSQLAALCQQYRAQLNILCHSEGNYMLMLALYSLGGQALPALNQVLSVAADINTGALQTPQPAWTGQGAAIARAARAVTVYWSSGDDILPIAEGWTDYHNPQYAQRLGLHGPASFAVGALQPNAIGLDCSQVVNQTVVNQTPQVPPGTTTHSAYFYIPQVLRDMSQTLSNVPPAQVANRVNAGQPDNQAFTMQLNPSTPAGQFTPAGRALEPLVPPARGLASAEEAPAGGPAAAGDAR